MTEHRVPILHRMVSEPGCYYGPDVPEANAISCNVCGFCRGETGGVFRTAHPSRVVARRNDVGPDDTVILTFSGEEL